MRITAGIDVGSTYTKAVVLDSERRILGRQLEPTGFKLDEVAENVLAQALAAAGVDRSEVEYVVSTGFGRHQMASADTQVTDLTASARGAMFLFPGTRTVLDVGGQTMKASRLDATASVKSFRLNDKCAAGTGRFLGAASSALDIPLGDLGATALRGERPVKISTTCTVFAESEVLSWLGKGKKIEDVLLGVHQSIGARSVGLLRRVGVTDQVTFTGGVARNPAMIAALESRLDLKLNVSEESDFMGALGAALFALDRILASRIPAAELLTTAEGKEATA